MEATAVAKKVKGPQSSSMSCATRHVVHEPKIAFSDYDTKKTITIDIIRTKTKSTTESGGS